MTEHLITVTRVGRHWERHCAVPGCLVRFARMGSETTRQEAVEAAERHLRAQHADTGARLEVKG